MAATDYVIVTEGANAYLTKKGTQTISEDRRPITESEMMGLLESFMRKKCEGCEGENTLLITNGDGERIFQATLINKAKEHE
jgi:hypothetical protein